MVLDAEEAAAVAAEGEVQGLAVVGVARDEGADQVSTSNMGSIPDITAPTAVSLVVEGKRHNSSSSSSTPTPSTTNNISSQDLHRNNSSKKVTSISSREKVLLQSLLMKMGHQLQPRTKGSSFRSWNDRFCRS